MKINEEGLTSLLYLFYLIMEYTSHKYKFEVKVFGETFSDLASFSVVRCPISNTASYAILNINLRGLTYLTMSTEIENGDFPELSVKCTLLDMLKNSPSAADVGRETDIMFVKQYIALKVGSEDYPTPNTTIVNCTIVLVNPILYYLNNTNSYNKILVGKTGMDLIKGYEAHLKKTFGDSFEFKKIGENVHLNKHKYEQVLIRLENDLVIPSWIIAEYKPHFTYSFYFFDDFRIDSKSTKDITAYMINMGAKDEFGKKSTMSSKRDADDIFMGNTFVKSYQIGDPFKEMNQDNPSMIIKNRDLAFKYRKATGNTPVPSIRQSTHSVDLDKRKVSSVRAAIPSTKHVDPTEETLLYAPDEFGNATKRLEQNSKLLKTDISGITSYLLKDTHFDFIQFGINYILNPFESKEFRYTPIGIVNNFVRESGQFPYLIHHCMYQTIKFKASKDWA